MPQLVPGKNGTWVAPVKPQFGNTGGDVLQLPSTGDSHIDQALRQMADFMIQTHRQTQEAIQQHADSIASLQNTSPTLLQKELSTKGSAPLNINGLLGVPSVLSAVPVNNTGVSANITALQHSGSDPGPASNAVAKYKQFQDVDGTQYFIPLLQ